MDGKKGSGSNKLEAEGCSNGGLSLPCKAWARSVWKYCKEEPSKVMYSLKVGLAVLLASLLVLVREPYEMLGTNVIWAILTVAVKSEYTVGSTFMKGFNRGLGTLLTGILAIVAMQLVVTANRGFEPVIIGIGIFLVGTVASFMALWPSLVLYEQGFRVLLYTFCLIIVSGYRRGDPVGVAVDRLYTMAIGGLVAVLVNMLVFPVWAGDLLHDELVKGFDSVADSLEECVKKYLEGDGLDHLGFSRTATDKFPDEPAYQRCRATLNSSAELDSLAKSAKWEPPHGRFKHLFYPWSEYVKVPQDLRLMFRGEIQEAAVQAAEVVRRLGEDISDMDRTLKASLLKQVHASAECLQAAIDMHYYLIASSNKPPSSELNSDTDTNSSTNPKMMKKAYRRLFLWPSREVDAYEAGGVGGDLPCRMEALESTTALSLATFASLLIEFVARLDHLADAVEELSTMAKFEFESEVEL